MNMEQAEVGLLFTKFLGTERAAQDRVIERGNPGLLMQSRCRHPMVADHEVRLISC